MKNLFVKTEMEDLNPRAGCPAYRISSADPSATWVHLHDRFYYIRLARGKSNYFWNLFLFLDAQKKLYYIIR